MLDYKACDIQSVDSLDPCSTIHHHSPSAILMVTPANPSILLIRVLHNQVQV